ncbi:helix-turn-helix domain-containing protein [Pseudovibrio exalbescens]|uniref:helix-turn-helix domain-containing protein n=1 Tax=Pseudovibrio exalbescens TaxID=197461 RepID=UPI0011AF80E8|nr:helix-turn-helix domain-containing protein [Pseudovibrio exalbescens]
MSHEATNWAIKQRGLPAAAKIVLWHLCDRYHPDHGCFPTQATLANDCEMARSTLNEHLKLLERKKLIARIPRSNKETKRKKSTLYRFAFESDFKPAPENPCPEAGHGNCDQAMSDLSPEPCPDLPESRVRNPDINSVIEPVIEPVIERERARENPEQVEGADTATVTPETWKRRLKRVHAQWPTFTSDSDAAAEKAWFDLSAEDRQAACDLAGAYIEQCKAEGRKKFCSFAVYLSEKRWLKVNAKAGLATAGEVARPFGKAWGAARFADLMREPYGVFPKPTGFIAAILERGGPDAERERAQRVARYGWPRVNTMQERAVRSRASITVDGALAPLADMFEPVKVGGEVWQAWRLLHEEHNWPWFGAERDLPEWVYMPARPMDEPGDELAAVRAALASFEAAYRETFSGQEAAE